MSDINITVEGGKAIRLKTAGKYCDKNIVVEATGGGSISAPLIVHSLVNDDGSFERTNFKSITIMTESIGREAFIECSGLESVVLDGVVSIGTSAFNNCTALASITIPEGVTSIGTSAFCNCDSLTSVSVPHSVTSLEYQAFISCSNLAEINYAGTVAEWTALDTNGIIDRENVPVHCTDGDAVASYDSGE